MYATLEEKGGEWEGNGESKAESSSETDVLRVFTKISIEEENTPATLHPTKWRGRRGTGRRPWAGAGDTVKPAQASTMLAQQARNIFIDNLQSYLTSHCSH